MGTHGNDQPSQRCRPLRATGVAALLTAAALVAASCSTSINIATNNPPEVAPTAATLEPGQPTPAAEPTTESTVEPVATECVAAADLDGVEPAPAEQPRPEGLLLEIERASWDTNVMAPVPPGADAVVDAWISLADQCAALWACTLLMPTALEQRELTVESAATYVAGEGFTAVFAAADQTATLRIAPLTSGASPTADTTIYLDGSTMRSNASSAIFQSPGEPCRYTLTFDGIDSATVSSLLGSIRRVSGTTPTSAPVVETPGLVVPSGPTGPAADFCTPVAQLPSTVTLDPAFEVGDERELKVTWTGEASLDTESDVTIIVEEVSSDAWVLVWREIEPLVFIDQLEFELEQLDELTPGYAATVRERLASVDIRYRLDAGGITTVLNEPDVIAHVDVFLELLDRLVEIDPLFSQADADASRASWGDDDSKVFAMTEGLFTYHTAHGWLLDRDQATVFDDSYPSGIEGSPFPTVWNLGIAAAVDPNNCLRFEQIVTGLPEESRRIINELIARDGTGEALDANDPYLSEDRTVVQLDYSTGWPRSVVYDSRYQEGSYEENRTITIIDITGVN